MVWSAAAEITTLLLVVYGCYGCLFGGFVVPTYWEEFDLAGFCWVDMELPP